MVVSGIFLDYAHEHRGLMAATMLMAMVTPAIDLILLPRLYVQLIDVTVEAPPAVIAQHLVRILTAAGALQVVHVVRSVAVTHLVPSFDAYLKTTILRQILNRQVSCDILTSGDIVYLLSTMSELSRTWIDWWNNQILPHGALLVCAFLVFIRLDTVLAGTFMAFLATLALAVTQTMRMSSPGAESHVTTMSHLHKHLEDLIRNVQPIQNADMVEPEIANLRDRLLPEAYRGFREASLRAQQLQTVMIPVGVVFMFIFLKRVLQLRKEDRMPHNEFVSVFFIIATLLSTFTWLMDNMGKVIIQTQHFAHMSASILRFTRPDVVWSTDRPAHRPPADAVIGMDDVTFTYQGTRVFQRRTLQFGRGERTAVVGPVGCGKSTLLRLLLGFCVPDSGHLHVDGQWYGEISVPVLRRRIGMIPQEAILFDTSLIANVRYGNEKMFSDAAVREYVVQRAGHILGDRVDTPSVGPGGQQLSGGQRQLVWCLRVFLRAPDILLMDEPTAFMDDACKAVLVRLLDEARPRRATAIMVTHDPFLLTQCDRTLDLTR